MEDVAPLSEAPCPPEPPLNLTTIAQWLPLQPISSSVEILYAIAEVRRAADDLKHLTRCYAPKA